MKAIACPALLFAALNTPLTARELAPLPAHLSSEHSDEGEDDYWQPPPMRGIYGHGYLGSHDGAAELCAGTNAEQSALHARIPGGGTAEFWFYATAAQGVLFERLAGVDPKKPCAEALSFRIEVERAFVADGMVQSMEGERGDFGQAVTRSSVTGDEEYSGAFFTIHNLMARPALPARNRNTTGRVAGLPVECTGYSGLVWNQLCVSRRAGLTYGMIVSAMAGDDESTMFRLEFDEIQPQAWIDGRVWQLDRDWRLDPKDGPRTETTMALER